MKKERDRKRVIAIVCAKEKEKMLKENREVV